MKIRSSIKEQPPKGIHTARVIGLCDLGHQPGFVWAGGEAESAYKLEITYELVTTKMKDGRPFIISEQVTNTDNERGTLSQRLSSIGIDFANIKDIIGSAAMVTVDHNAKGYAKVSQVSGVPQGMDIPEAFNPSTLFDIYDEAPDLDVFYSFSDFKQGKFRSALDFDETVLAKSLSVEEAKVPE